MLLFSTTLSITDKLDPESFIRLVIEWNDSSTHPENIIPDIHWNGERNIRYGNDSVWLEIAEHEESETIAVRYQKKQEDGRVWTSDYIADFKRRKICISLERSYEDDALITDQRFSTPHILTMLIQRGYISDDHGLEVLRTPQTVSERDSEWLTEIFRGRKHYHLPIVYVSLKKNGQPAQDISLLSSRLKGAAHVLVATSSKCDTVFQNKCNPKVETGGDIGIYYLSGNRLHKNFSCSRYAGRPDALLGHIVRHVISYGILQKTDEMLTWNGVTQAILEDNIRKSRNERLRIEKENKEALAASKEETEFANNLIASVDEEIEGYKKQIAQLQNQVNALTAENTGLRGKMNAFTSVPLLYMGDERELYDGEIREFILAILAEEKKNVQANTRRADVIEDILNANPSEGLLSERTKRIHDMFKGYKNMGGALRKELEAMGMEISEDGSHYKMKYYGDNRYMTVLPKSGSDHRGGENISHEIIRLMF